VVAYDAILRAAGHPSTFRTGLATMTGPRWYGVSFLLPAFLASQQEPYQFTLRKCSQTGFGRATPINRRDHTRLGALPL